MRHPLAVLLALASCAQAAPIPAPTDVENLPKPGLRLSPSIRPRAGQLALRLDPSQDATAGTVTYVLELARPEAVIWVNATDLAITGASVDGAPAKVVPGDADVVGLAPEHAVGPGAVSLQIAFTGKVDKERSRGIYRVDEGTDPYLFTFFESVDARRAFPCFDEPGFKIPWTLALRVPKADVGLANAPASAEHDEGDGTKTVTFAESKPMPSYLVAFGVGPFTLQDGGTAGHFNTPLRVAVPRGREKETRFALQSTPKIIGILEDYFGMPYPYGKLDVLVVPRYWGTMEHPGLVALGQPISLMKPEEETVARQQFYVDIGGHELGHYWFGDYVTMAWWDDTWLNEALGEWLDAKLTSSFEPRWNFMSDRLDDTERSRSKDGLESAKAIEQPVETKEAIENAFDADFTYLKGSAVLRMFEGWLGEDAWRAFVREYLAAHAWGNASAKDFHAKMAEKFSPKTADAFETFLTQPGIPVVTAEVHCDGAPRLALSQKRDTPRGQHNADELWKIPVCWRTEAGRSCQLLETASAEVPLPACPAWLVPNAGGMGYYRVAYTPASAKAGLAHMDAAERSQLAYDVTAQVRAGTFALADALALVPQLVATKERHAITASMGMLSELHPGELDDALYARYAKFIEQTYGPHARALGWTPIAHESNDDALLRPEVVGLVASVGEDPQLVAEAQQLANIWLSKRSGVDDDVIDGVLTTAARHGDAALFDRMLALARDPKLTVQERTRVLWALGAFRQKPLAQRALAEIANFDLREARDIAWSVDSTRETRELAWGALQQNWDNWVGRLRGDEATGLIGIGTSACNATRRQQAEAFLRERVKKIDGGTMTLDNGLGAMDVCIAQRAANEATVRKFLGGDAATH